METQANDLLGILLRDLGTACGSAANPQPWYPADFAKHAGVSRARVDTDLDRLRLGGLVQLTEWAQGKGQGYVLTAAGVQVLENPRLMQRLRQQGVEPQPAPPPLRPVEAPATPWARGESIRNALFRSGRPVVTMLLIMANVMVFLAGAYLARAEDPALVGPYLEGGGGGKVRDVRARLGGLTRSQVVLTDEWWRLLGYAFVHGSFFHLLMNMISLWMLGRFTEAAFGPFRYLILYLVSALGGGCAVVLGAVGAGPEAQTVGASGGVCGLLAAAGMWVFLTRSHLPPDFVSRFFRIFTTNVILVIFVSTLPHVSLLGHLGGAVAGGVIAIPLVYDRFGHGWKRWLGLAGAVAVPIACVALVALSITGQEQQREQDRQRAEAEKQVRERVSRVEAILVEVQEAALATKKQHVAPFTKKAKDKRHDDAALKKAQEAFTEIQERLRAAAKQLDRVSFAEPRLAESLDIAKEYVTSWLDYFAACSNILNRRAVTPQDRQELERLHERSQELTRRLNESPLFSNKD